MGGPNLPQWWRSHPVVLRDHADIPANPVGEFFTWCRDPAIARLYVLTEERKPGSARAGILPSPEIAPQLYRQAVAKSEQLTILLNRIESVTPIAEGLRASLPPGPDWRKDDVVATLSSPGSGIGFHAGHEDGYVIQLAGSRNWRVWSPDVLSDDYRWFLLGRGDDEYAVVPQRPQTDPLLEVELTPGDVLYLPALFPHEGVTLNESVSASVAWRGFGPYSLLRRYAGAEIASELSLAAQATPQCFFSLLRDPQAGDRVPDYLVCLLDEAVQLDSLGLEPKEFTMRLQSRLEGTGRI